MMKVFFKLISFLGMKKVIITSIIETINLGLKEVQFLLSHTTRI